MESDKQGGSETSSEENDQLEQVKDDMTAKRSYGCTFCKRGFTNAQALGGHMNIHRKDRAKAKQLRNPSLPNNSNEDNILYTDISPVSFEPTTCFPVFEAQTKYRMYSQPSATEPGHPHANLSQNDLSGSRPRSWNTNQEFLGANLSLNIGATLGDDDGIKGGFNKAEEVDLELRLGHDPYWK